MFYEELYAELGKVFYLVAAADGKIHPSEKASLKKFIDEKWKPLEDSSDDFGTDKGNFIGFSFDYEEAEAKMKDLQSFELFYKVNRAKFTEQLKKNILETSEAIAASYKGTNKKEEEIINEIKALLEN